MMRLRNTKVFQACKLFALPAIALAVAFCNSEAGPAPGSASSSTGGGNGGASSSSTTVTTFVGSTAAATSGTGGMGGPQGVPLADAGIPDGEAPAEPVVACDPAADAGGGDLCPLPPPACAANRWIVYYDNPECTGGFCHFDTFAYDCAPKSCIFGGCEYNFTAP